MKTITVALEFAGIILPVGKDEKGHDVVPLKPITEIFGLKWEEQRLRAQAPESARRWGTCTHDIRGAGQAREMVCIRLNRVAAYLYSISPTKVRAAGNISGADFLERKQEEWDNLIHDYEVAGGTLAKNEHLKERLHLQKVAAFLAINREKRLTQTFADRDALSQLSSAFAAELGIPFQMEIDQAETMVSLAKQADAIEDKVLKRRVMGYLDRLGQKKSA